LEEGAFLRCWACALIGFKLLPLFGVFDFGFEIGGGAAVGADEDGVGGGGEEGADALVVPGVGARGDEETLARLGLVRRLLEG
jgi:hypothetical protein